VLVLKCGIYIYQKIIEQTASFAFFIHLAFFSRSTNLLLMVFLHQHSFGEATLMCCQLLHPNQICCIIISELQFASCVFAYPSWFEDCTHFLSFFANPCLFEVFFCKPNLIWSLPVTLIFVCSPSSFRVCICIYILSSMCCFICG